MSSQIFTSGSVNIEQKYIKNYCQYPPMNECHPVYWCCCAHLSHLKSQNESRMMKNEWSMMKDEGWIMKDDDFKLLKGFCD